MFSRTVPVLTAMTLLMSLALVGCSRDESAPTKVTTDQDGAAAPAAEAADGQPKIASDGATYDFGKIGPKQTIEHVFTIKNVGGADLKIDHVQKT